jgi:hypothetical protein
LPQHACIFQNNGIKVLKLNVPPPDEQPRQPEMDEKTVSMTTTRKNTASVE